MPNDNSRFAQAASTIASGAKNLNEGLQQMDPVRIKAQAQERQNQLQLQGLQLQEHQTQAYQTQQAIANKGINDTILQGLQLDDPKAFDAFMNDRQGQLNQYYQMKGQVLSPSTFEVLKTSTADYKAARQNLNMLYNKVLSNRFANKYSPVDVTPDQLTKLRNDLSKGPTELYSQDVKMLKDVEDLAQEQAKAQFNRDTEIAKAAQKAANDAKKPTQLPPAIKSSEMQLGKDFAGAITAYPKQRVAVSNIDNALKIVDKVGTGPINYVKGVYRAKEFTNLDAQRLKNYLSVALIDKIMDFAKSAGVRSIDTEQERQGLKASIASENMSGPVLKETLNRIKAINNEAMALTKAKQAWLNDGNTLGSFDYDAFYNSQNAGLSKHVQGLIEGLKF